MTISPDMDRTLIIRNDARNTVQGIIESPWLSPIKISELLCKKIISNGYGDCCHVLQLWPKKGEEYNFVDIYSYKNKRAYKNISKDAILSLENNIKEGPSSWTPDRAIAFNDGDNEIRVILYDYIVDEDNHGSKNNYYMQIIGLLWISKKDAFNIDDYYRAKEIARLFSPPLNTRRTIRTSSEIVALQIHEQSKIHKDSYDYADLRINLNSLEMGLELWQWDLLANGIKSSLDSLQSSIRKDHKPLPYKSFNLYLKDSIKKFEDLLSGISKLIDTEKSNNKKLNENVWIKLRNLDPIMNLLFEEKDSKKPLDWITPRHLGIFTPFYLESIISKYNRGPKKAISEITNKIIEEDKKLFCKEPGIICDKTLLAYAMKTNWCNHISLFKAGFDNDDEKGEKDIEKLKTHNGAFQYVAMKIGEQLGIDKNYKMKETFDQLEVAEPMMYWGIKRYRDHLLHSCRMAILGLWLLDQNVFIRPSFSNHHWNDFYKNIPFLSKGKGKTDCCSTKKLKNLKLEDFVIECKLWHAMDAFIPEWLFPSVTDEEKVRLNKIYCETNKKHRYHFDQAFTFSVKRPDMYQCPRFSYSDLDDVIEHPQCKELIFKMLILATTKHDIGYCFTYLKELFEKSEFIKDKAHTIQNIRNKLLVTFRNLFQTVRTHATSIDSALFETTTASIPHGVIGAFHVKNLIQDEFILDCTAKAIAKHDDSTRKIYFEDESLSWILLLLDELQEWGRPVYTTSEKNYQDPTVYAQKLLAECDLRYLIWYKENGEVQVPKKINKEQDLTWEKIKVDGEIFLVFEYDYNPSEVTLRKKEVQFSFPHFFYFKQVNLSKLMGGPLIKLRIMKTGLAEEQFKFLKEIAIEKKDFLTRDWSIEILKELQNPDNAFYDFELGVNKIPRPPNILPNLLEYIDEYWKDPIHN